METWQIVLLVISTLAIITAYYLLTSKKRRRPFYTKSSIHWREYNPTDIDVIKYSIFLIGDSGAPSLISADTTLDLFQSLLLKAGNNSAVFFLGDNIYPKGMPRPSDPLHDVAERRLVRQLKALEGFEGKIGFISGNHDWNKGRKGGYESVRRQQYYIDAYFNNKNIFLPRNGCPGPVELPLSEEITAIIINTQWWVHGEPVPVGKDKGCVESEHEFFIKLEELLKKNQNKRIIVLGHHPMYSYAYHGGKFSIKQHLFPLTEFNKKLYIPLPIAGSLYPLYRKYIGSEEDMAHPRYKNMRRRLINIFKKYDNLIYASGHDHNLQYIQRHMQHYIVSGSGSKVTFVQKGKGAQFAHAHKGFVKLSFYYNHTIWLEVWEPSDDDPKGILAYRKQII